jgi:hypothetical protein
MASHSRGDVLFFLQRALNREMPGRRIAYGEA